MLKKLFEKMKPSSENYQESIGLHEVSIKHTVKNVLYVVVVVFVIVFLDLLFSFAKKFMENPKKLELLEWLITTGEHTVTSWIIVIGIMSVIIIGIREIRWLWYGYCGNPRCPLKNKHDKDN